MVNGCAPVNGSAPSANTPGSDCNAMQAQVGPEAQMQDFMRAITECPYYGISVSNFGTSRIDPSIEQRHRDFNRCRTDLHH
jgi:hypothetical protein